MNFKFLKNNFFKESISMYFVLGVSQKLLLPALLDRDESDTKVIFTIYNIEDEFPAKIIKIRPKGVFQSIFLILSLHVFFAKLFL